MQLMETCGRLFLKCPWCLHLTSMDWIFHFNQHPGLKEKHSGSRFCPLLWPTFTHKHTQHDANKRSHSALPRPDNGWRVWGVKSNETAREQQLSVSGYGGTAGRRGLSQDTSVLVKTGARPERGRERERQKERGRAALTITTSPKWLPVKVTEKEAWITAVASLWCELMKGPPGSTRINSAELEEAQGWAVDLWGLQFLRAGFESSKLCEKRETQSYRILNCLHVSSRLQSFTLFSWLTGFEFSPKGANVNQKVFVEAL